MIIKVRTQTELDQALREKNVKIGCIGGRIFEIHNSSQVTAYDSSRVVARDSSQVTAYDSSQVRAKKFCAITIHSQNVVVTGGHQIFPKTETLQDWFESYSIEPQNGEVILYKAVDENLKSAHPFPYAIGKKIEAPNWDGDEKECGDSLYFCPTPVHCLEFFAGARRFLACKVPISEIVFCGDAKHPTKVKARCAEVLYEVDINGERLGVDN